MRNPEAPGTNRENVNMAQRRFLMCLKIGKVNMYYQNQISPEKESWMIQLDSSVGEPPAESKKDLTPEEVRQKLYACITLYDLEPVRAEFIDRIHCSDKARVVLGVILLTKVQSIVRSWIRLVGGQQDDPHII